MTTVATPLGRISHAEARRRELAREAERNLIADLESIHTDLEAAKTTAGYVDDDLADEIEALREKVAMRLGQYP